MPEEVLAFKRELFPHLPQSAFIHDGRFLSTLLSKSEFVDREKAECDFAYKQLIPYSILRFRQNVFRYKRSAWGKESRLHGLYSIGVGGHINKTDALPLFTGITSAVEWARDRELREEFDIESFGPPRLIGFLNDDGDEVGRVHFCIVYEYWLNSPKVTPREKRNHIQCDFMSLAESVNHKDEYESWSRIIIDQYFSKARQCHNKETSNASIRYRH